MEASKNGVDILLSCTTLSVVEREERAKVHCLCLSCCKQVERKAASSSHIGITYKDETSFIYVQPFQ